MEKVDIFDQEIGRAAIECNGNLVVVFNGKKAFWFKEQIESFVKEHPEAPLPLSVFCVTVSKVGEPCKYKGTGNSFSFVARSVSPQRSIVGILSNTRNQDESHIITKKCLGMHRNRLL